MLIRRKFMHHTTIFFLGASSSENWTELKKDQLVRVGCDTCKIPEKCETVFGSSKLISTWHFQNLGRDEFFFSKKACIFRIAYLNVSLELQEKFRTNIRQKYIFERNFHVGYAKKRSWCFPSPEIIVQDPLRWQFLFWNFMFNGSTSFGLCDNNNEIINAIRFHFCNEHSGKVI